MENHPVVQAAAEGARMDMLYFLIGLLILISVPMMLLNRAASRSEQTWTVLAKGTVLEAITVPMPHLGTIPDDSYPGTKTMQTVVTFTDGHRIALSGDYTDAFESGTNVVISQNGSCRLRVDCPGEQKVSVYRD